MLDEPASHLDAPFETSRAPTPAPIDWHHAHEELSRLARARAHLDWEEGAALLSAERSGAHLQLGYATFAEYIGRLFGYTARWTAERMRVAEALHDLPELAQALRDGAMSWSAVRELSRVAVAENEHAWLQIAQGRTLRQIEELVSGHQLGDAPGEPSGVSSLTHVLRWKVSAEVFSTVREAMAKLRRDAGEPLDDDAALLLMARHVLGGPADAGRANYQVALTVCEECRRGWQQGAGVSAAVGPEIVEMACCDAQHLDRIPPPIDAAANTDHAASACTDAHVGAGCGSAIADSARVADVPTGHIDRTGATGSPPGVAVHTDPSTSHVDSSSARRLPVPGRPPRARQDVPPAVRRDVMRRDGGRCVVPGCRHGVFLDLHHIELRSEGGDDDPDSLVVLCSAHHRAQHRGQILIEGRVSTGLTFRHADGTRYGVVADPLVVEAHLQAFRALRTLGFREGETRRALEQVRSDPRGAGKTSTEGILRAALSILSAATRSVTFGPGAGAVAPSWIEPTESEASRERGLAAHHEIPTG